MVTLPFLLFFPSLLVWLAGTFSLAATSTKEVRKIIIFQEGRSLVQGRRTVHAFGGRVIKELPLIHALVATFPREEGKLHALSQEPEVELVEEDATVETCALPCPAPRNQQTLPWGVERIGAPAAWPRTTGAGVKVAVLDTGVDAGHPDLKANLVERVNLKFPGWTAGDNNGHGTHVAGIIAAADNTFGVVGVAPQVQIYAVKIFDYRGRGFISDIISGLEWACKNKMQIVNMSFGTKQPSIALQKAVEACLQAGILLVAAAGNEGDKEGEVLYPARYPGVLAVTATTREDKLAGFSSRGPEVSVAAPGAEVLSTYPGGQYRVMSGTSMAAPHVSGVLALILGSKNELGPDQARKILKQTACKLPGLSAWEQGAGLVNAGWLG
ncbi:MAG: S8 family peptidase [Moorellaceae bacterium]